MTCKKTLTNHILRKIGFSWDFLNTSKTLGLKNHTIHPWSLFVTLVDVSVDSLRLVNYGQLAILSCAVLLLIGITQSAQLQVIA